MVLGGRHLVYAVSSSHCPRTYCTFKIYNSEELIDDLNLIPFDIAYLFKDIDDIYGTCSYLLSSLLNDYAPVKARTTNHEHVPFMTPGLLKAIRKCNKSMCLYN